MDLLTELEIELQKSNRNIIIRRHFNAKSCEWGSPYTNRRGVEHSELLYKYELYICNDGKTPTFRMQTTCSETLGKKLKE